VALSATVIANACLLIPFIQIRFLPIIILGLTSITLGLRSLLALFFRRVVRLKSSPIIKARFSPTLFIVGISFLLLA